MTLQQINRYFLFVPLALLISTLALCGPSGSKTRAAVVTYASPDALVIREGAELKASIGMVLKEKDVIQTASGPLDLQTTTGATVRVRQFTRLELASLLSERTVRLDLKSGIVSARVNRIKSGENFSIATPTAIAGVRGTAFTVEEDYERGAVITVLEGSVAMQPFADKQKLAVMPEVIIEPNETASLTEKRTVTKQAVEPDLATQAEFGSMVAVDEELLVEASKSETTAPELASRIEASYNSARDEGIAEIAKSADAQQFKPGGVVEILRMKDGKSVRGRVLTQAGDVLVIQTESGVERYRIKNVNSIDYAE